MQEFRTRLQAVLNSSMIAATSAVSEHAKALLDVLTKDAGQSSYKSPSTSPRRPDDCRLGRSILLLISQVTSCISLVCSLRYFPLARA